MSDTHERLTVRADEVQEGDYLHSNLKARVHATSVRENGVALAYRVKGSKAPGMEFHAPDHKLTIYRRKP
jgi:hypothetical protein